MTRFHHFARRMSERHSWIVSHIGLADTAKSTNAKRMMNSISKAYAVKIVNVKGS